MDFFITCGTVIGVCANVMREIDIKLDVLSSTIFIVHGEISTLMNGPIVGNTSILFDSVANHSVPEFVSERRVFYT